MNQILDYATNNSNYSGSSSSDKIVRIFAILLIIFAVALITVLGVRVFANKEEQSAQIQQLTDANIEVEIDGTQANIKVTHDKKISKIIYSWNDSTERTVKGSDRYMETSIDVPAGDNTLHIKVVDEIGNETTYDEEISAEQGVDIINPNIDLTVTPEKKIRITATDETAMDFITYRWNEDDEEKVFADEGSKTVETDIDIPKGENHLTVIAVDASSNTTNETKDYVGITKPEINAVLSDDGSKVIVKVMHENGIKSVNLNFNGNDMPVQIGDDNPTEISFEKDLVVGENHFIITAKSVNDTENTFDGKCNYGEER